MIDLIRVWLSQRSMYVTINGIYTMFFKLDSGIIQGSILGPVLHAVFLSPLFHLTDLSSFADNSFTVRWNKNSEELKE